MPYHVAWQGSGPPLLLLHGFTGHKNTLGAMTHKLADHFQVFGVDLPGHGHAIPVPPQKANFIDVIRDLYALLDRLGQAQVHCVGYSMGGRLGLALACQQPTTPLCSLSVLSASPGLADGRARQARRWWDQDLMKFIAHTPPAVFPQYWQRLPLWNTTADAPTTIPTLQQRLGWSQVLAILGTGHQPSLWPQLPTVTIPVQFVTGANDKKYTALAARMHALVPDSTLVSIPGAGHRVHLDAACATARLITRFVQHL